MTQQPPGDQPPYPNQPPPSGQPPQYVYYQYPPPRQPWNGFAIASLVLGCVWMYGVTSVLAVIFGHVSLRQIKERGEQGQGLAIAGLVLGYVGIVGGVVAIIFFISFFQSVGTDFPIEEFGSPEPVPFE